MTVLPRFTVNVPRSAQKTLSKLDRQVQTRLITALTALETDPRPDGAIMLKGHHGYLRIRVGNYRTVYTVHDDALVIVVIELGHRRGIYGSV